MNATQVLKAVLPVFIVAAGIGGARFLMSTKKVAEKKTPEAVIAAVEYVTVSAGAPRAVVLANGTVEGVKVVSLSALVSGEVVEVSGELQPGGRFRAGQSLLRVDPRDYEIAVDQERSRVQQAELELKLEEQRVETALREWELLGGGKDAADAPLALRGPQLEAVEQALEATRSGLKRAQLNLERTRLKAPFNALVISENVEEGQLVSPGAPVATLVGTDRFRVKVSVPVDQLRHVAIPAIDGSGSEAIVTQQLGGGEPIVRSGRVSKLAGQLDPATRTAELFIVVDDPLEGDGLPLLPGAFVSVRIEGKAVDGAIEVPRDALVDGSALWTIDESDQLARRPVVIGWSDADVAYVVSGLDPGSRVVVTPPSLPVQGAPVRPREAGAEG
jgi:RND family efflux transporter MFP subunit